MSLMFLKKMQVLKFCLGEPPQLILNQTVNMWMKCKLYILIKILHQLFRNYSRFYTYLTVFSGSKSTGQTKIILNTRCVLIVCSVDPKTFSFLKDSVFYNGVVVNTFALRGKGCWFNSIYRHRSPLGHPV